MRRAAWLCGLTAMTLAGGASAQEPSWDAWVESAERPIRVLYTEAVGEAKAVEALGYAEEAWQAQIEQMGFTPPRTVNESGDIVVGLWLYLDPDAPTNHIEPLGDIAETAASDCAARVVIPSVRPSSFLEMFTAYGLNVASELGTDCVESFFAYQQTGVAVTVLRWPQDQTFLALALPAFQQNPQRGVDCTFPSEQDRYFYGAGSALFQVFLEEARGQGDGALLAAIWQAARQDGSILSAVNEPTLLDAIRTVLGDTTLEQAFVEFARWRWFVGSRDDGAHFRHGGEWSGGEVRVDTAWALADLPVTQATLADTPDDFGTAYVELDLAGLGAQEGLRFTWQGDASVAWSVDALLLREDGTAEVETSPASGELALDALSDYARVVFVVDDLGNDEHDPDFPDCAGGPAFSYDLEVEDLTAPPTVVAVDPRELAVGHSHEIAIDGDGFFRGLTVQVEGGGVDVGPAQLVDHAHVTVELTIAADAAPGPRALTVTNPGGGSATVPDAIVLLSADEPDAGAGTDAGPEPADGDEGCGCSTPGGSARGLGAHAALVLAALVWVRRRARACRGRADRHNQE